MWNEDLNAIVLYILSIMIFFLFTIHFFRYLINNSHIQIRDATKEHNWKAISGITKVKNLLFYIFFIFDKIKLFDTSH